MTQRGWLAFVFVGWWASLASAQVNSGPSVDAKIEPLKLIWATGDAIGQEADGANECKEKTTLYVFVRADRWERPVARFLRTLDQDLASHRNDIRIVAVWLTDDVEKSKNYLPIAQQSLKLSQTTFAVYPDGVTGPNGWGINGEAHITIVIGHAQKVVASFGYRSVSDSDVPTVVKKLPEKK